MHNQTTLMERLEAARVSLLPRLHDMFGRGDFEGIVREMNEYVDEFNGHRFATASRNTMARAVVIRNRTGLTEDMLKNPAFQQIEAIGSIKAKRYLR